MAMEMPSRAATASRPSPWRTSSATSASASVSPKRRRRSSFVSSGVRSSAVVVEAADEDRGHCLGLQPGAQLAAAHRQDMREHWRSRGPAQGYGEAGLAEQRFVPGREAGRLAQLLCGRRRLGAQGSAGAPHGAAVLQHVLRRAVGMQDAALTVGQHDAAPQRIECLGHAGPLDRAGVEHVGDGNGAPQMRQEKHPERSPAHALVDQEAVVEGAVTTADMRIAT